MEYYNMLLPLAIILIVSKLLAKACTKFNLPTVVGLLITGLLMSLIRYIPGQTILDATALDGIGFLAKIGVILIMFETGLETDVKQDLVAVELHDGTSDQVAFVKRIDGAIDEGVHLLVGDLGCIDDGRILDYAQEDPFLRGPRISRGERFLLGANRNITVRPIPHATIYCTP